MNGDDICCLPIAWENSIVKAKLEEPTKRASQLGTTFFQNSGRDQVRTSSFSWVKLSEKPVNNLGLECDIFKGRVCGFVEERSIFTCPLEVTLLCKGISEDLSLFSGCSVSNIIFYYNRYIRVARFARQSVNNTPPLFVTDVSVCKIFLKF